MTREYNYHGKYYIKSVDESTNEIIYLIYFDHREYELKDLAEVHQFIDIIIPNMKRR